MSTQLYPSDLIDSQWVIVKDYERQESASETMIRIVMIRLMPRRLAGA